MCNLYLALLCRDKKKRKLRHYYLACPIAASILGRPDVESLNGTEDGQSFDYEPNEVIKPKPLPRKKLSQETSSSSGETSGGVVKGAGSKQALLDEGQGMDLKIEITERKFSGVKQDFISYRVCTQVCKGGWGGGGGGGGLGGPKYFAQTRMYCIVEIFEKFIFQDFHRFRPNS